MRGRVDEVSGCRLRRCSGGWVDGQMPREMGGTVDGRVEVGGWMEERGG